MRSFLLVRAQETILNSLLLHFLLSRMNECMGNGLGLRGVACSTTSLVWAMDDLGLGLWGLDGNSLGLGALLARDRDN